MSKQDMFVSYYLGECKFNGTAAAIKAGYAEGSAHVTAYRLLRNDKIKKIIDRRVELYAVGPNERLQILADIARDADEMTKDRLKAVEMMGKLAGDYIDRIQSTGDIKIVIEYADD